MTTILDFLKKMESKTIINTLTCDEFKNREFQKYCTDNNIKYYILLKVMDINLV